ncbi:oxygenase MpaB family protein [Actinomadura fibrosa]|uniref:Oxygenase MpaB family protein n=1 Tax=Actinomadura fibrosa TaxID=111802 RepID=A0ABW2XD49_9ACTN|nr:oxygenase MpaB family protein [Actinomadura fibrosa]
MRYTDAVMDRLSLQGDPFADETVATLLERGEMAGFNGMMRWFQQSGQALPEGLPPAARDYLEATARPPKWVDWGTIEDARLFFIDNNVHISTALAFASMPLSYAIPRVARLLTLTHSLEYPSRRMAETGQFTVYLMQPDAFEAGGRFVPAAQKVRLLHAGIRHHLRAGDRWDEVADGVPLSQEDMIGGQVTFSLAVLDALDRLGVHMSTRGAEAYYYAWRVVGAMLGCDVDSAPADLTEARAYLDSYMVRGLGPSPEGVRLTQQLIALYEEVVPGRLLDPVVAATIRLLIGDTCADWLEVPRSAPWDTIAKFAPAALNALERLEDAGPWTEQITDRIGALVARLELTALTHGRVMHYAIPEHLKSEYDVPPSKAARWTPPAPSPTPAEPTDRYSPPPTVTVV